jgi:hypothetical protein
MLRTKDNPDARETDDETKDPIFAHWERMKVTLAGGWELPEGPSQPLLGAIGLALDFQTWRTMARQQGLSDEQAIELMVGMVLCAVRR